jgi:hypothetical protein
LVLFEFEFISGFRGLLKEVAPASIQSLKLNIFGFETIIFFCVAIEVGTECRLTREEEEEEEGGGQFCI